jgi:hypothetical protein
VIDPETGEVDRDTVIAVLRYHRVEVSPDPHEEGNVLMVRGTVARSIPLDPWVKRKTTDFLKRTFAIPIHHFFRPEMMTDIPGHSQ